MSTDNIPNLPVLAKSRITPVVLTPAADVIVILPGPFTIPPAVNYVLGKYRDPVAAIPGKPAEGMPGLQSFKAAVAETPAIPEGIIRIRDGSYQLTAEEWANWQDKDDSAYLLEIVTAALGLTLTK